LDRLWTDYQQFEIGLSEARSAWVTTTISEMLRDGSVLMRRLQELLGRLTFVMEILEWGKPFLAPIYAWCSASEGGSFRTLPLMVRAVLCWIKELLQQEGRTIKCQRPLMTDRELSGQTPEPG